MKKLTEEERETMVGLESELTMINEQLGQAKGKNRKNLTLHYTDRMLGLFLELKKYRRLSFNEKVALKFLNMNINQGNKTNSRRVKQARNKVKNLVESGKLKGVEIDEDFRR